MKKRILAKVLAIAMVITTAFLPSNCILAETTDTVIKNDETGIIDKNLYDILLRKADTNGDTMLTIDELENLTTLDIGNSEIKNLKGLEYCINLKILWCYDNQVKDLMPLSNLTNLVNLDMRKNEITDISCLSNLVNLESLNISDNQITDISVIANFKKLISLDMRFNEISDISTVAELEGLQALDVGYNEIKDFSALKNLTGLTTLDLFATGITDISFLKNFSSLQSLGIGGNDLSDISVLSNLTNLVWLDMGDLNVKDISVLSNLTKLETLWFFGNQVDDISALSNLINLVWLDISGNFITDISSLSKMVKLQTLHINSNEISDISSLAGLTELNTLYADSNEISDITPLKDLSKLIYLDLSYNRISDFSVLEGKNIENLNIEDQIIEEPENPNESEVSGEPEVPSGSETPGEPETPNANRNVFDIKENPIITIEKFGELLEANKEQDVVIQVGNNISITFGKGTMNVVEGMSQYDFTTAIVSDYTQANIPSTIQLGNFISKVVFHYSGKLPAEASIRIPVGVQHAGKTLYYTLLKDDGTFAIAQAVVVDTEGYITVKQDHCSSYVITTENPNAIVSAPKTGDDFGVMWMMVIAAGVTMSVLCIMKSRRVIKR